MTPILQISSMSILEWQGVFELCTAPYANNIRNAQYVEDTLAAIYQVKPPLSPLLEQLFRLHVYLFISKKLMKHSEPSVHFSGNYMGYFTRTALSDMHSMIDRCLEMKLVSDEPEQKHRITETLDYLRQEMLMEPQADHYYSTHYNELWKNWIRPDNEDNQPYVQELQQLDLAESELGGALSRFNWKLAQSKMHFHLHKDQDAWKLLKEARPLSNHYDDEAIVFLRDLATTKEWSRLIAWLTELGPTLGSYRSKRLNEYSTFWDLALEALPDAELQMWDTLVEMLPFSSAVYEEQLLRRGNWQLWMDYQLTMGREPLSFRVTLLRPLEKEAPEMLLPFYHQAVERYVLEKNRSSYKSAVKLLKRLAKLYKKMKQEARWEGFLSSFASRHSRLRALQEELRKGKLLS